MQRRVVVTGMGAVSPVGLGVAATWAGLVEGRSGIGPITAFDASRHDARIAGEVHGLDAAAVVGAKLARRTDRFEALRARCPWIQQLRVKGAMVGVDLSMDGAGIVDQCLHRRLLINCTHGTVLRLLPALNLTDAQLDEGCGVLEEVLLASKP